MKAIYRTIVLLLIAMMTLSACNKEESPEAYNAENVAIIPQLSGVYAVAPAAKAGTRAVDHPDLQTIINLPEGTTLRLIAKKGSQAAIMQDYVVRTPDGGSQSLYPCKINNTTGQIISESKDPMYLSEGVYTVNAVSPAHKYSNGQMVINNGESVLANNDHWIQTATTSLTITKADKSKVILLNPLMQLTARMTFDLSGDKETGVSSISVMQDGIEIDRIREGSVTLTNVGDSIPAIMCANYNRIFIKESDIKKQENGSLRGEICLLPIDNRATPMVVILNLMVNGVPTQFTFSIVNKVLYAGYSYNYKITVRIKDNITVANWQETSWSTTVSGE